MTPEQWTKKALPPGLHDAPRLMKKVEDAIRDAVMEERRRCASICDGFVKMRDLQIAYLQDPKDPGVLPASPDDARLQWLVCKRLEAERCRVAIASEVEQYSLVQACDAFGGAVRVGAFMSRMYHARQWCSFWLDQIVAEDLGAREQVLAAVRILEGGGKVRSYAVVRCQDGHDVWAGPAADEPGRAPTECPECEPGNDDNGEGGVFFRYDLTPKWKQALDSER